MSTCIKCGKKGFLLKVNFDGMCENCQRAELDELRTALLPEQRDAMTLKDNITRLTHAYESKQKEYNDLSVRIEKANAELKSKQEEIVQTDELKLLQEFGLYEPKYAFRNSDEYKNRLAQIRQQQKDMVKAGTAVSGNMNWTVNGSASQGKKMIRDMQKLLLRAFNAECEEIIDHVKYNNYDASLKRISTSWTAISKLGTVMSLTVTEAYYGLKVDELTLALEYQQMKEREKEEQREARARMREEVRLQKEIEAARRKTEKELTHYQNELKRLEEQIEKATAEQVEDLQAKRTKLIEQIENCNKAIQDIDYREANQRAGYVYVISNIGSFGPDIYKIGMTRRLDPTERVYELGDASVPFKFDIHAMIFADDAPSLEAALHRAFESKKLNMVNQRREFFHVTLDEIKAEVKKNYDKTAEFVDIPDAEQYRISCKMRDGN